MRIEKSIKLRDESRMRLCDIMSHAESFGLSSAEINKSILEKVFRPLRERKAPYWVETYLQGVLKEKMDSLYRDKLVFGAWIEGKFFSNQRKRPDYYEAQGLSPSIYCEKSRNLVGHYWAHKPEKVFFRSEEEA